MKSCHRIRGEVRVQATQSGENKTGTSPLFPTQKSTTTGLSNSSSEKNQIIILIIKCSVT